MPPTRMRWHPKGAASCRSPNRSPRRRESHNPTPYENAPVIPKDRGRVLTRWSRHDLSGDRFARARVMRHTACRPGAPRQKDGPTTDLPYQSNVIARIRPTLPMTNRDSVSFHSDYIPPPPTHPQVSVRRVRQARWHGPELPGVFPADPAPPDPDYAFTQATGLGRKVLRTAKTAPFQYPH
jgi:hypothetical protein